MADNTDYSIDPADAELAASLSTFDPVTDVPGAVSATGNFVSPTNLKASTLPPDKRGSILAAVADAHPDKREELEHRLVSEALYGSAYSFRVLQGPGAGANAFQREVLTLEREKHLLDKEAWEISVKLVEVERWDTEIDPTTHTPRPVPVERLRGADRRPLEARLAQIEHHLRLLNGPEGDFRKARALKAAVDDAKRQTAFVAEREEVQRRAEEIAREARIQKQAEARARFLSSEVR